MRGTKGAARRDPIAAPPRRLMERNFGREHIPDQAKVVWGNIDEQLAVIAVMIHNSVVVPATGAAWNGRTVADAAPAAFAGALAMAQREAGDLSLPDDQDYLRKADVANSLADRARATIEEADRIVTDTVELPGGARCPGPEAVARHAADRSLALEREEDGSSRHRQHEVGRFWVIAAACILAALDVMLLWRPLLNLGAIASAGALYKWLLAFAFAGVQALAIELAVHRYRERERDDTELRETIQDYNREVRRASARGDAATVAKAPPAVDDLPRADERLRTAHRWLLMTAYSVGIIAVFRVAFLSRSGGQTVLEATVYGAIVGVFLGASVLLLASFCCRGNRLGDRVRAGAALIADIDDRINEGERRVAEARDDARLALTEADGARARAADTREWVLGQYWQALLLATGWLGLTEPPIDHAALVAPRELQIADAATRQVQTVRAKLAEIDTWLGRPHGTGSPTAQTAACQALERGERSRGVAAGRLILAPRPGESGGMAPEGHALDPPPTESRWLLVGAAVLALGLALGAAAVAPTPYDVSPTGTSSTTSTGN